MSQSYEVATMVEHELINDPGLQGRVRRRYRAEIAALERLGFQTLGFGFERMHPFSAIVQLPALFAMAVHREVLTFPAPLRIGVATALMRSLAPSTIALCMGMGVKLYTRFSDDTILISSTFQSRLVPKPGSKIIRPAPSASIELAWADHAREVGRLGAQAQGVRQILTYADFLEVVRREEDFSQYER